MLWAVTRVHKGLLICVLCNVKAVGGGNITYVFVDLCFCNVTVLGCGKGN